MTLELDPIENAELVCAIRCRIRDLTAQLDWPCFSRESRDAIRRDIQRLTDIYSRAGGVMEYLGEVPQEKEVAE